jgi:hypothetical protein
MERERAGRTSPRSCTAARTCGLAVRAVRDGLFLPPVSASVAPNE